MAKLKSLSQFIGSKINDWTILSDLGRQGRERIVNCICDCGTIRDCNFYEIKRGKSISCGCGIGNKKKYYIGKKYNRLTISECLRIVGGFFMVKAICECGVEKEFKLNSIITGNTKSCGCLNCEKRVTNRFIHGASNHPLMSVWGAMIRRCYNENDWMYYNYGGKGVIVCDEWLHSFNSFYEWAKDKWKKGLHLDKDILAPGKTGDLYCPEYCSFVTTRQNNNCKSNTVYIFHDGVTMSVLDWSDKTGIPSNTIRDRIRTKKWTPEKALTQPVKKAK